MKSAPAARLSQWAGITWATPSPASTAIADVEISAPAEPRKIAQRELPPAASVKVASCVLSPSSARKTAAKVDPTSLQSIFVPSVLWQRCLALDRREGPLPQVDRPVFA